MDGLTKQPNPHIAGAPIRIRIPNMGFRVIATHNPKIPLIAARKTEKTEILIVFFMVCFTVRLSFLIFSVLIRASLYICIIAMIKGYCTSSK